ncbi:class I SAM-dependent methyltransferase [Prochlorococcus marinus]|uniref:Methyltransferase domain-containing protein n=1 Tax=Prochlorococcus marinus XMU1408 TaxID=2213228 RepID=A0A318R2A3_PROMR|nr:class I SAM-dependent methyltransferase [Prochlorococcus marinus]MBW3041826.1 hypothetical protein [Prochlorococcus marinus str. XMU1408]PYE02965.1 hypothetical protein DNJ73_04245 [Prochlorococcus marinus XMU1408]
MPTDLQKNIDWYKTYSKNTGGAYRNSLINPENFYQVFARDIAFYKVLNFIDLRKIKTLKVLDVGCGDGNGTIKFIQLGFLPSNVYGIELIKERLEKAKNQYPNLNFMINDASNLEFESNSFDLVNESTMFIHSIDKVESDEIAKEMIRVTKKNKYIILQDWRYSKPWNHNYNGLSKSRIKEIFSVGVLTELICQRNGALIPPLGRRISRYFPYLYFIISALFPFLVGGNVTLLRKL